MKSSLLTALALTLPFVAQARDSGETAHGDHIFVPADFSQYAPQTALDMVSQIPGFRISDDNNEARGFGQASQNVLINGQRISSKSTNARDALSRIPAANVEKIELVEGANLDIPGLSGRVVNVTAQSSGITGTWEYRARFREALPPFFDGIDASVTGEGNNLSWTLGLESDPPRASNAGRKRITDANNELIEYGLEQFKGSGHNVTGTATVAWTPDNGNIGNLNLEYSVNEWDERETSNRYTPDDVLTEQRRFEWSNDEWNSEISGDYEFGLGSGRLKLIGLQRNGHRPTVATFFGGTVDGLSPRHDIFKQTVDESESIFRLEYNLAFDDNSDWQFSAEGAFNMLESEAALQALDANGNLAPVNIGTPEVTVEERRGEAFVTHSRQLSPKVRLQTSLGLEMTEITSDGPNGQVRTFNRPKGFLAAIWEPSETLTVNARLERTVGQLDFFDFVSSVDVNLGDNQSGNGDIVPEQSWRAELEFERDYGVWGAGNVLVFAEALEDIVDQVPIGTGEGPGNLDTGSRIGVELEGTIKFDRIGWRGAQLEVNGGYYKSEVDDPLTGETRRITRDLIRSVELELRHDIPNTNWAWGLHFENEKNAGVYRLTNLRRFEGVPGFAWGFVEHKDLYGMTASVFVANLFDQDNQFTRAIYAPDRTGTIDRVEDHTRNFGPILTLRLKGTF